MGFVNSQALSLNSPFRGVFSFGLHESFPISLGNGNADLSGVHESFNEHKLRSLIFLK